MSSEKVDMYIVANAKYFPQEKVVYIKEKMANINDAKYTLVSSLNLKDPTMLLIVSILLGGIGVDRFMLGDIGLGILKLLTLGVFGILTIIDWFTVTKRTKEKNFQDLMHIL